MREEIGKYLLYVSKLVLAGVVLGAVFEIEGMSKIVLLVYGLIATITLALLGFLFMTKRKH